MRTIDVMQPLWRLEVFDERVEVFEERCLKRAGIGGNAEEELTRSPRPK